LFLAACTAAAACSSRHRERPPAAQQELGQPTGAATFAEVGSQVVLAAATTYPAPLEVVDQPPVSLTASDGSGLRLVRYAARAVVHGPLAFTELRLSFANPEDRVLEGRFQLALPEGAAISRLAMRTSAGWQEAEVVELGKARRVYEDFLHRAQDPALLEREAGNLFRARIFPIPARATKDLIVSFSQELASPTEDYRLPLRGLPQIDRLDVAVAVVGAGGRKSWTRLGKRGWVPDVDFAAPRKGAARALRAGRFFASYVSPLGTGKRAAPKSRSPIEPITVAFDTSASRSAGFARAIDDAVAMIAALGGDRPLAVFAFDQEIAPIYRGQASGFGERERRLLRARRPMGASNLGLALDTAAEIGHPRLVIVGDAVATAGIREPSELVAAARRHGGLTRVDVVIRGGIRDRDAAMALAAAKGGAVIDGDRLGAAAVARALGERVASGVEVRVAGARWVYPGRLDGVLAGQSRVVYGELGGAAASPALAIEVGGRTERPRAASAPIPLLERAVAGAEISMLEARLAAMGADAAEKRAAIRDRIIAVSTESRVLSRFTGLLVLETEEDYRRFEIDRTALADVLTVSDGGEVVAVDRAGLVMPEPGADANPAVTNEDGKGKDKKQDSSARRDQPAAIDADKVEVAERPEAKPAPGGDDAAPPPASEPSPEPAAEREMADSAGADADESDDRGEPEETGPPPISGPFAVVRGHIEARRIDEALVEALAWHREKPGDVMALVALGEALEAAGHQRLAARAYGSIIDLFPSRADLRRYAGMRLARLTVGVDLAADSFAAAVESRPDHLTGHRLLAYAHARAGRYDRALAALEAGLDRRYPPGRFAGGTRVLADDLSIIAAAQIAAKPEVAAAVRRRLAARELEPSGPTVRFVLSWETDANDVDFHIYDGRGGHASFRNKALASGGELYADITDGYGPECFAIDGLPQAGPYRLRAHYYSRGPMGYGIGQLEIVRWDGAKLSVEARPFVVMNDGAYLELGSWGG
jgi:hypothetical protein